jgi:hypothetical protein
MITNQRLMVMAASLQLFGLVVMVATLIVLLVANLIVASLQSMGLSVVVATLIMFVASILSMGLSVGVAAWMLLAIL